MKTRFSNVKPVVRQPDDVPGLPKVAEKSWAGLGGTVLLAHALLALIALLLRRAWPAFDQFVASDSHLSYVFGSVLMQGGLILLPTLAVILLGRIPPGRLLGGKSKAGSLILAFTIGIPAAVVFQGMNNLLIYGLARSGIRIPTVTAPASPDLFTRPLPVIILIIAVSAILPGIIEELMFRGVIYAALSSTGAVTSALIWQAAAFALFHGDPLFILPPFLAGLMLASIRRSSGSLLPAVLAHISLNLSLAALTPLLPRLTADYLVNGTSEAQSLLYASLIAACVAAVALVPLLVLINLSSGHTKSHSRLNPWPVDWKFVLAFIVLIVTIIVEFN